MAKRRSPQSKSIPFNDAPHEWCTVDEAKAILRIGRVALNNLLKRGDLPFRQVGRRRRIPRQALRP